MVVLMSDDNETESEQRSKAERAEAVEKALSGDAPRTAPPKNDPAPPEDAPGVDSAGERITRGGEEVAREEARRRVVTTPGPRVARTAPPAPPPLATPQASTPKIPTEG